MPISMRRNLLTVLSIFAYALPAAFASPETAKPLAEQQEWRLDQVGDNKQKLIMYVAQKAVRIEMPSMGFIIISKAPDWKVHCFRNDEKKEWIGPMDQFSAMQMTNPYAVPKARRKWPFTLDKKKDTVVCGLPATRYRTQHTTYTCANEMIVDPMIVELMNKIHGTPQLPSVPLSICANKAGSDLKRGKEPDWIDTNLMGDLRSGKVVILSTENIKRLPFTAKHFELPKGYTRKKDLVEVSYSADQRSEINEMLNSVGYEGNVDKVEKLDREKNMRLRRLRSNRNEK